MQKQQVAVHVQTVLQLAQATVIKQMVHVLQCAQLNAVHVHPEQVLVRVVRKDITKTVIRVLNAQREHIKEAMVQLQHLAADVRQAAQNAIIRRVIAQNARKGITKTVILVLNAQPGSINQVMVQLQ